MSETHIRPGTIVWLKTGSPAMTVKFMTTSDEWECSWFVGNDVKEHSFSPDQLTTEDPNPKLDISLMSGRSNRRNSW